jgi:hypothetical protein
MGFSTPESTLDCGRCEAFAALFVVTCLIAVDSLVCYKSNIY